MNNFEKCLVLLSEMASLTPREHHFNVDVKIHILKEHDNYKVKHGPRIKVYNKFEQANFTISISDNPRIIGEWEEIVSRKDLNKLIECVKFYKVALLNYWYDVTYQKYDLVTDIENMDEGNEIEKRY